MKRQFAKRDLAVLLCMEDEAEEPSIRVFGPHEMP